METIDMSESIQGNDAIDRLIRVHDQELVKVAEEAAAVSNAQGDADFNGLTPYDKLVSKHDAEVHRALLMGGETPNPATVRRGQALEERIRIVDAMQRKKNKIPALTPAAAAVEVLSATSQNQAQGEDGSRQDDFDAGQEMFSSLMGDEQNEQQISASVEEFLSFQSDESLLDAVLAETGANTSSISGDVEIDEDGVITPVGNAGLDAIDRASKPSEPAELAPADGLSFFKAIDFDAS